MVVAIAAVAVIVLNARGDMSSAVLLGLAFVALLVIGLGLAIAAHRLPGADRAAAIIARRPRLLELARRLRDGLAVAGRPRTLATAIVFSAIAWSASAATFLAAGQAIGVELSFTQAALLTCGVALATIIPSGPGYLGTFELTTVGIAGTFGVGRDDAFAMGLLVHVIILAVTSIGGLIAGVRLGVWRDRPASTDAATTTEVAATTEVTATSGAPTSEAARPESTG